MALKFRLLHLAPLLVCLAWGSSFAADDAATPPASAETAAPQPAPSTDPKPKEEDAGKKAPEGSSTKDEPDCNN